MPAADPGAYLLFVDLPDARTIAVGALGPLAFAPGAYAYVGSARGGLAARIARHARREKRRHWHIDYLLAEAAVAGAAVLRTKTRAECPLARSLAEQPAIAGWVPRFGASDCNCPSHLARLRPGSDPGALAGALGLSPFVIGSG